ncbi:hypothetical protein [Teredinibacter haidensis]|uniref:hypothetical protein n=1 Tax=Teredinibacter haidensis TaxID=2731755 RepID=UPI00111510B7|nr:hypothetical protein [Teredinibacter haidensis]
MANIDKGLHCTDSGVVGTRRVIFKYLSRRVAGVRNGSALSSYPSDYSSPRWESQRFSYLRNAYDAPIQNPRPALLGGFFRYGGRAEPSVIRYNRKWC